MILKIDKLPCQIQEKLIVKKVILEKIPIQLDANTYPLNNG